MGIRNPKFFREATEGIALALSRWRCLMFSLLERIRAPEVRSPDPAFIGRVPYLLVLRAIEWLGILARYTLHWADYSKPWRGLCIGALSCGFALVVITGIVTYSVSIHNRQKYHALLTSIDIILLSFLYIMTGNPQSDLFIFYYLSIIYAAVYFSSRLFISFIAISISYLLLSIYLAPFVPILENQRSSGRLATELLPRTLFLLTVAVPAALLVRNERSRREEALRRADTLRFVFNVKKAVDQTVHGKDVIATALKLIVGRTHANGAYVALNDPTTNKLEITADYPEGFFRGKAADVRDLLLRGANTCFRKQGLPTEAPVATIRVSEHFESVLATGSLSHVPIASHGSDIGVLGVLTDDSIMQAEDFGMMMNALAECIATGMDRVRLVEALGSIGKTSELAVRLNSGLDALLDQLVNHLGFEFASISLVDPWKNRIEMVRGVNVPPGWVERSTYSLDEKDILADIVRSGRTEVIEGPDERGRFNEEIYRRFDHGNLARVWTPLIDDDSRIGTLEAGCHRGERVAELLCPEKVSEVEKLAREYGPELAHTRQCHSLEIIAQAAMDVIGAGSATIHVYRGKQLLSLAGAGRAGRDFLMRFSPRPSGLGQAATEACHYMTCDQPVKLKELNGRLYEEGVRAYAAFPLRVGSDASGLLYVHFWRQHEFTSAEIELENVFARQVELVIQSNLLLQSVADAAESTWTVSSLQNVVQSLGGDIECPPRVMLEGIAQAVLVQTDAANVTIYEYDSVASRFMSPPVMKGTFEQEAAMYGEIGDTAVLWGLLMTDRPFCVPDTSQEPLLQTSGFVQRERIKSCAICRLGSNVESRALGLMFVNFTEHKEFNIGLRRTINALASSAALAIDSARYHISLRKRLEVSEVQKEAASRYSRWNSALAGLYHRAASLLGPLRLKVEEALETPSLWSPANEKIRQELRKHLEPLITLLSDKRLQQAWARVTGMQTPQPTTVIVKDVLSKACESVSSNLAVRSRVNDICLWTDIWPEDLAVNTDDVVLQDILEELITNAIENTTKGERVVISGYQIERAGHHQVVLVVADRGTGMNPDEVELARRGGYTTKDKAWGIGMTRVHAAVDFLGIEAYIASDKGRGTTWVLLCPAAGRQNTEVAS